MWFLNRYFPEETVIHNVVVTNENNIYFSGSPYMSGSVYLRAKKITYDIAGALHRRVLRLLQMPVPR